MSGASIEPESRRLTRYLLGVDPSPAVSARFREATEILFPDPPDRLDARLIGLVASRPWTLSYLDAALPWVRPSSRLRRRILVMAAILETTTEHHADFDAETPGPLEATLRLVWLGLRATARVPVGLAIYGFLRSRR